MEFVGYKNKDNVICLKKQQTIITIPVGFDLVGSFFINLFLYFYESEWITKCNEDVTK